MLTATKICFIINVIVMIQGTITISYLLFKAKRTPVLFSLCIAEGLLIMWLFFSTLEFMSTTTEELLFAVRFSLFPLSFVGGAGLIFALLYAGFISPKNKLIMLIIMLPLAITYLPALTNDYFYLIIIKKTIENPAYTQWGVFYIANLVITYIYLAVSLCIILYQVSREFNTNVKKVILIIVAIAFTPAINALTGFGVLSVISFDITPASFSVLFSFFTLAISKYKFLNIIPVATHNMFFDMEEAVFITDNRNCIMEYNKASSDQFGGIIAIEECKTIDEMLSELKKYAVDIGKFNKLESCLKDSFDKSYYDLIEIFSENETKERSVKRYSLYMKPLTNKKGRNVARIYFFRNNTDLIKAQIEEERKRISGDIHDNLSNMVNVIKMNLEYAVKHFDEREEALSCINTAYDTVKGVRINIRRILEELLPVDIESVGLINALESLFKKVIGAGMKLEFYHNGINGSSINKKRHGYVIYRICMEAINNSFFNGKANTVSIVLTNEDGLIKLFVTDDGMGCEEIKKGRGLRGIERNVIILGGKVEFGSFDEGGFNIRVEIPFEE